MKNKSKARNFLNKVTAAILIIFLTEFTLAVSRGLQQLDTNYGIFRTNIKNAQGQDLSLCV